jgi:oligopeptide transport system substrate-binding protein
VFRYKNGSSNNTNWENALYSAYLDRSTTEVNPQERIQLLKKGEHILMEEMPILPLFYFTMLYLEQPHLKDVVLTSMGALDFKWAEYK